jgi:hypothetical protein
MDTNSVPPDDVNELERRLSAWQPSDAGLAPAAMLFAAGRASVRASKGWLAWPILSGCLASAVVALGVSLQAQRSEVLALREQLERRPAEFAPAADETPATEPPAPGAYLALRRQWEEQSGDAMFRSVPDQTPKGPVLPEPPIYRAWQPDGPPESL